ncbi:sensor histidine kinase [Roseimaritima sediminicola]|uniref:HAMP domain-containing histidine kinase n=1 Tax=Roseimaritima sediminicola TaxID=2662066 RepID=UPI0012984D37|nr:HAMP domain-containing histidine kinase [Roseimaritima sediminicola]
MTSPSQASRTTQKPSLRQLVERVTSQALANHAAAVTLTLDIDPRLAPPGDADDVTQLLQVLIGQSLNEMAAGELSLIAWQGPQSLELEIADSGSPIEQRSCSLPMIAGKLGSRITRQNCPQGGAAVTIHFPGTASQQEAA